MYYTIYKTTNILTDEYYIGQHKTNILNDGYLGSGVGLKDNINKYGRDNFKKEILFILGSESQMNEKEVEIVTEEVLNDPLCLNRQPGGYFCGWKVRNSVIVFDEQNNKWKRIRRSEYDSDTHITPTSGTVRVYDKETKVNRRIPTTEYHKNKNRYTTHSSNRVSVYEKMTGASKSISLEDYDPCLHEKVFGGVVAIVDGKKQYVSKEHFKSKNLEGCHKGKVTVMDTNTGITKHVTTEEYHSNKARYKVSGHGKVTVFDTRENKRKKISVEEFRNNPTRYNGTTHGQKTVWDISLKKYKNIPKEDFDRKLHRLSGDKMIICTSSSGETLIDFWGSKKDFVAMYGGTLYNEALKETHNYQPKQKLKFAAYIGCSFKLIDWSNQK